MAQRSDAPELVKMRQEAMRDIDAMYRKQKKKKTYKNLDASVRAKRKEGDVGAEAYYQLDRFGRKAWKLAKDVASAIIPGYWQSGKGRPTEVGGVLLGKRK